MRRALLAVVVLAAAMGTQGGCGSTCGGADLKRSVEIIEAAWLAGWAIGDRASYDVMGVMQQLIAVSQQLNSQAQQLPPPCQQLIQMWAETIRQAFSQSRPSGTTCRGGVCCDSSGCYG